MKKRLNLLCACVLIGLLLSTSTAISLMVQAVSAGFKAGYESVEKGKELNISDYKIVCTIPSDLFAETGSVTNLKNSSQASIKPIISLIEAPDNRKQPIPNGEWNHYLNFGPSKYLLPDTIFLFDPKYQPW